MTSAVIALFVTFFVLIYKGFAMRAQHRFGGMADAG